jgi:homoserine O-acetyltransferase
VIWICHALTANSDALDWWGSLAGTGKVIDPARDFIVCANMLGSCYGSSGPDSKDPETGRNYGWKFPAVTIRDMVGAHRLLREHLGIPAIKLLVGGSMGGYQALEWALAEPEQVHRLLLLTTGARESAWGIAIHTTQRLAIEADPAWSPDHPESGKAGLKAARAIGMLTYRNYDIFVRSQTDPDPEKLDGYRASSYILHQGDKLARRFNPRSYWLLTKAMDSHNIARGRSGTLEEILSLITQPSLIIGITSDILCPPEEQLILSRHMPRARYREIDSLYGHDGFIIEGEKIGVILTEWWH